MRILRGYLAAAVAAAIAFTLVTVGIERETDPAAVFAGLLVFGFFALAYAAVLTPAGLFILRRLRRDRPWHFALAGAALGWLATLALLRDPAGLIDPIALAFAGAGLAAGFSFRVAYGPATRSGRRAEPA
jgi:hypothetical protein